jgi:phage protein D
MAEAPTSDRAVYSARPTVRIAGQENARATELLSEMDLTESEGGLTALELKFSNLASLTSNDAELAFEDESSLKLGAQIAVYGGDQSAPQEIFRGVVTGLEAEFSQRGAPELTVLAEDKLQQARMQRLTKVHEDLSIADLARSIASDLGLTPNITGFSDNVGTWAQINESQLAFLRRLVRRYDGDVQVVGDELHVSPRADVRRGALELSFEGQLARVRVLADLAHQVTGTSVTGWDAQAGQRVSATSSGAHLGPGSGRTGADILRDAIAERVEHLGHLAVATDGEARALADAAYDQRARRFVRVEATAEGNPALRVGTHVTLSGLSPRFDNTYYVVRARHRFDSKSGYKTEFEAECAYLGNP